MSKHTPAPWPGMRVTVRGGFGRELPHSVVITDVGDEGGRKVIDYVDAAGQARWAYEDQIIDHEDYEARAAVEGSATRKLKGKFPGDLMAAPSSQEM